MGVQITPCEGAPHFLGERTCPGMPNDTAVSYAKMGEPIKMPFGLWSRMGPSKHVLHWGAHCCNLVNTIELSV